MRFGVHDRFVNAGSPRSEAGDFHEIAGAGGMQRGPADLGEFVAEVFDVFRFDFGAHGFFRYMRSGLEPRSMLITIASIRNGDIGRAQGKSLK